MIQESAGWNIRPAKERRENGKIQFKKWSIIPITSIEKKNTTYYRFIYCSYTRILFHEKEYGGDTFLP